MSNQTYYLTEFEYDANICDYSVPLAVNCAGIFDEDIVFDTSYIRRDFYYLYLIRGSMQTHLGQLTPGDLVIFEPNLYYSYKCDNKVSYLWMHFTGSNAAQLIKNCSLSANTIMNIGIHQVFNDRFEALFREFIINDENSNEMMISLLKEILILSGRYKNESISKTLLKSMLYINRNFTNNITVDKLAEIENMSLTKYRSVFKEHTSTSPLDYITMKRINSACLLLAQTERSITEIASAVGYDDPYYFSRIFKKKIGISPKQYQKNIHP